MRENRVGALAWGESVGEGAGGSLGPQGVVHSLPCTVVPPRALHRTGAEIYRPLGGRRQAPEEPCVLTLHRRAPILKLLTGRWNSWGPWKPLGLVLVVPGLVSSQDPCHRLLL